MTENANALDGGDRERIWQYWGRNNNTNEGAWLSIDTKHTAVAFISSSLSFQRMLSDSRFSTGIKRNEKCSVVLRGLLSVHYLWDFIPHQRQREEDVRDLTVFILGWSCAAHISEVKTSSKHLFETVHSPSARDDEIALLPQIPCLRAEQQADEKCGSLCLFFHLFQRACKICR